MNDSKIHAIIIVSIILSLAVVAAFTPDYEVNAETRLKSFTSYDELKNFVSKSTQYQGWYSTGGTRGLSGQWLSPLTFMESTNVDTLPDYSTTNVQVEGVDEADIVKTDGTYIYVISKQTIIILEAYPAEEAQILSRLTFEGNIKGVFINEDRLAVFEDTNWLYYAEYKMMPDPTNYQSPQTTVRIYNIADRAHPASVRNVSIDGGYFSSRMIGDYVYVLAQQGVYMQQNEVAIPRIMVSGTTEEIPATDIYYTNVTDNFNNYLHVLAVNILNDQQEPASKSYLLGYASTMYVSPNNIYIAYPSYQNQVETTRIHRIRIEEGEIDYEATGEVPGHVLNQFSMDEFNGYFRMATTIGEVWSTGITASRNNVYVLDMELDTVGSLEDLAPGEKIYSARFMGNRCYLVTFRKIDPLFVIDLGIPAYPQVLGQLKITGYSDYLHPYDENHIIGIGKETIEAEEGNFAWYQGVKISLFDVTDVAVPKEITKYEIGDRGTDSPILYDHKAFLFDREKNLLVIPVTVAEIDEAKYPGGVPDNMYGDFVWDGAYVFHISLEDGLEFRAGITHLPDNSDLIKSGYWYHSEYSVKRSLYIDNVLYTISELKIKMNSLADLSEIGEINLNA
jgi:uncharacterized secreted protein with C-terminal beta-propeller domain